MRIFDGVKRQLAISDDGRHHVRELMDQFGQKRIGPSNWSVIRVLGKGFFMVIVVLVKNKTTASKNRSLRCNFDGMTIGITHDKRLAEFEFLHVIRNDAR